jgi:hypothetical protein
VICEPERVTALVDGELDPVQAAAVAAHLASCPECRAQADAERALRERLRALPPPALPSGLEARLASRMRRAPAPVVIARWALPLAAVLVLGLWARGHAPFVAWDLARDHDKCFSRHPVPAKVWSDDPAVVGAWFEERGTRVPALPGDVGDLRLVGARYCPLLSIAMAPHVYYASAGRHVSIFVVGHDVRMGDRFADVARGDAVRLLRVNGQVVGIVGEHEADVRAVEFALRPVLTARAVAAGPP